MKKGILFDIQFGASGDMLLGSLLDLGLDNNLLLEKLSKLNLKNWEISPRKTVKYKLSGTTAGVECVDESHSRKLDDINKIITDSGLADKTKKNILNVFRKLAEAEASVHGMDIEKIHFHEVGALDAIIDISAFSICMELLDIDKIYFNDFHFGTGTIKSVHGDLPVPVPAVVELTKKFRSKITQKEGENITPTAAAILTSMGEQIQCPLSYTLLNNGTGFGTRDNAHPNYTRALLISLEAPAEEVIQIECNIDDMNPQVYPDVIEKLLNEGALDAYFSQIAMKKGRTGSLLTVILPEILSEKIKEIIYRNTTTLGIRILKVIREKLERRFEKITLFDNEIKIKIGYLNGEIVNIQAEFDDCKRVSEITDIPLKEIMARAISEYRRLEENG